MDAGFLNVLVKIIVSLVGASVVFGIGVFFKYLKSSKPKTFSELLVIAQTVVKIVKAYVTANPDVGKEAQFIYDLFVKELLALVPSLTVDEVNALFNSIVAELAKDLGIAITEFSTAKVAKIGQVK